MKFAFLLVSLFSIGAVFAADQTPGEKAYETKKLAKVLKGKTLECWQREDTKKAALFTLSIKEEAARVSGELSGYQPLEDIHQLSVGNNIFLEASGVDSDEGTAVVIVPTYYLEEDGEADGEALIYAETGPGDGSGKLVKLSCRLR